MIHPIGGLAGAPMNERTVDQSDAPVAAFRTTILLRIISNWSLIGFSAQTYTSIAVTQGDTRAEAQAAERKSTVGCHTVGRV